MNYDIDGMVSKNKDSLYKDLLDVTAASNNNLVGGGGGDGGGGGGGGGGGARDECAGRTLAEIKSVTGKQVADDDEQ